MSKLDSILGHLADYYIESHPSEAAHLLEQQNLTELKSFISHLRLDALIPLLEKLSTPLAANCLEETPRGRMKEILLHLPVDIGAGLLRLMPIRRQESVIKILPEDKSRVLHALIHFPENTAGSLMDPHACQVPEDFTMNQAEELIKKFSKTDISYIYTVNREGVLKGRVLLSDFLSANPAQKLRTISKPAIPAVAASSNAGEILAQTVGQDYPETPVVDDHGRLLGVLHYRVFQNLQKHTERPLLTPLTIFMRLGEASWIGLIAACQQFIDMTTNKPRERDK